MLQKAPLKGLYIKSYLSYGFIQYLKWIHLEKAELSKRKRIIWNADSDSSNLIMKLEFVLFTLCNGEYYNRCDTSESYQDWLKVGSASK